MDIKKSKLNISVSIFFKIITMIMSIAVKSSLVNICGVEVNGLNSLYLSIIGVLSVAELGVGSAITFSMYKPIVEGNIKTLSALYRLFEKLYLLIGAIIFASGLAVTPFLKFLAKDYADVDTNMYLTFLLVLISVVLTYLFSSKTSLINAYKNNYITTAITQGGIVFQYVLQIIVLYKTRSFVVYLVCRIIAVTIQWILTEVIARKKHGEIIRGNGLIDNETRIGVKKSIKAMFMHKIGTILVNTVDSVIISAFVGVVILGEYSNYTMLLASVSGVGTLIFSSLTSVIGHFCIEEEKETTRKYFECFHMMNFFIGVVLFWGYYAVVDQLITILFSENLVLPRRISFIVTLNGFVQFMRCNTLTFRDATGTFYEDRWKPLFEGGINIILSIILVNFMGAEGVIVATIITNLIICHIIEPYILYRNVFDFPTKKFYIKNYVMILLFFVGLMGLQFCLVRFENIWFSLLLNGFISLGVSFVLCLLLSLKNKKNFALLMKIVKKG